MDLIVAGLHLKDHEGDHDIEEKQEKENHVGKDLQPYEFSRHTQGV